jgi:cell division protein FtsL
MNTELIRPIDLLLLALGVIVVMIVVLYVAFYMFSNARLRALKRELTKKEAEVNAAKKQFEDEMAKVKANSPKK